MAAAAIVGACPPAFAQPLAWSVSTTAAVASPGNVQANYASSVGSSATVDPTTRADPTLGFSVSSAPAAPGSFWARSSADLKDASTPQPVSLASAAATADLGTASLSIAETANFGRPASGFPAGSTRASASLSDVLTFHLARTGATNIDVFWTLDAKLSGTLGNAPDGRPAGDGSGSVALFASMNGATFQESAGFVSTVTGPVFTLAAPQTAGWLAFAQRSTVPGDVLSPMTFHTVFTVTSANPVVAFNAQLSNSPLGACANGAACSASTHFTLGLPTGVTFTSASHQFLAGPVPEPTTWAMLVLGTGTIAWTRRRAAARVSG